MFLNVTVVVIMVVMVHNFGGSFTPTNGGRGRHFLAHAGGQEFLASHLCCTDDSLLVAWTLGV